MGLFGNKSQPQQPRRQPRQPHRYTQEQRLAAQQRRLAMQEFSGQWNSLDPEQRMALSLKILHVEPVPDKPVKTVAQLVDERLSRDERYMQALLDAEVSKAVEKLKPSLAEQFNAEVTKMAIDNVKRDPELAASAVASKVKSLLGGNTGAPANPADSLIEMLDAADRLKERLGGGNGSGFMEQLLAAVIQLAPVVVPLFSGKPQLALPAGQSPVPATSKAALTEGAVTVLSRGPQDGTASTMTASEDQSLRISAWLEYLDRDPSEFIDALLARSDAGDKQAQFAIRIITMFDSADPLLAFLAQFTAGMPPDAKAAFEKLRANKAWLESAMAYLQKVLGKDDTTEAATEAAAETP